MSESHILFLFVAAVICSDFVAVLRNICSLTAPTMNKTLEVLFTLKSLFKVVSIFL